MNGGDSSRFMGGTKRVGMKLALLLRRSLAEVQVL
jgi:hypothetical protein